MLATTTRRSPSSSSWPRSSSLSTPASWGTSSHRAGATGPPPPRHWGPWRVIYIYSTSFFRKTNCCHSIHHSRCCKKNQGFFPKSCFIEMLKASKKCTSWKGNKNLHLVVLFIRPSQPPLDCEAVFSWQTFYPSLVLSFSEQSGSTTISEKLLSGQNISI